MEYYSPGQPSLGKNKPGTDSFKIKIPQIGSLKQDQEGF